MSEMLVEFSVENFRSIRERVTLSLIAANLRSGNQNLDDDNVIPVNSKLSLLRSVVMYGANASGKSNIFKAFAFMRDFVINSVRKGQFGDRIETEPFCLTKGMVDKPSTFEAVFLIDGVQYRYGFSVTVQRVVAEWLYFQPTVREVELFTRDERGIYIKPRFHAGRGLVDQTRDNALFLSVVAQFNGEVAKVIVRWLREMCQLLNVNNDFATLTFTLRCLKKGYYLQEINDLVGRFDVDIAGLSLANVSVPQKVTEFSDIFDTFQQALFKQLRASLSEGKQALDEDTDAPQDRTTNELRAFHTLRNEQGKALGTEEFPIKTMESEGTQKLISLAGSIVDALARGVILFIDEIDARLHPLITSALVRLFNSRETNPNNAQLICATHDTNLLDRRLFRRDQIYFVEKDRTSASRLYSLAEFKLEPEKGVRRTVRNDASYERDYIQGRYGAIPYIGDLAGLFSEELTQHRDEVAAEKILEAAQ